MKKEPNFFIIGAPKSGTSSLASYLSMHENVFFTKPKEPWFFSFPEFPGPFKNNFNSYLSLFKNVKNHHTAIGEGSVYYLHSNHAVKDILQRFHDPKFIVMLRNPIDAAFSSFVQNKKGVHPNSLETLNTFKEAWKAQDERLEGKKLPKNCGAAGKFQYRYIYLYFKQLERLFSLVKKENIQIILFEDFVKNTEKEYVKTLKFLRLPIRKLKSYEVKNQMGVITQDNRLKKLIVSFVSFSLRIKNKMGITKSFNLINSLLVNKDIKIERPKDEFRDELINYFKNDIKQTENLIGIDLSEWGK